MDYRVILSIIAITVGFVGYAPYLRDVFSGKTKPHAFSWIAWGVLETVAFFAQIAKGGGAGAWITAASAGIALLIAGIALYRKETEIKILDYVVFAGALAGIISWRLTDNPLLAVVLVTISDALAFVPTFRKSYYKPEQETLIEYVCAACKWILAIFALQAFNLTTILYPASLILTNSALVIMSFIRRKVLKGVSSNF